MHPVVLFLKKGAAAIRRYGVLGTARWVLSPAVCPPDDFDQRYGTNTSGTIPLWKLHIESEHAAEGVREGSVLEGYIRAMLDPLPRDAVFVDLGSGRGRVLCIASMMGFRRVVGVEFSPQLCAIAEQNLQITNQRAEVNCADAARYQLPLGPLIVYLCDPFGPSVMQCVAQQLRARTDPTWIVYVNPRCQNLFEGVPTAPLTPVQAALFSPDSVRVYHR